LNRYILLSILLISKISFGQSFITKVSATTIGRNDVLQIEYQADDVAMDEFVLPQFNKWTVLSGPNLSSSTTQTGNVIKEQTVYSVIVQPNTTGTLTIPGATALINNKQQRSNPVTVQVKNVSHIAGSQAPTQAPSGSLFDPFTFEDEVPATQYLKKGEKAIDKIKNNIVIRLEVNKHSCYVGEPILATYKLCTRLRSKSKVVKQPQFTGCTVVELTGEEQDQHVEKINGVQYNVFVIRKVQLMPLAAGKLVLPEASVENRVSFYDAANLSYRDLYYSPPKTPVEEQLVTLQNKPETIEVKPLPAEPSVGITDFSGAIGNFDATVAIKESSLTTNTTNHLEFAIEGQGNVQQVKAPEIKWPTGIEAFETKESTDEDKSGFPVKYKKTFSFPFIANKKGTYTFPHIDFTYFDPAANRYVTKSTRAFTLPVEQGKKSFFQISNSSGDSDGFKDRLYVLLGTGLVAVVAGLIWYNGKTPKSAAPKVVAAPLVKKEEQPQEVKKPDASEYLYAIRELQPDDDSSHFYKMLNKNLEGYTMSKFGIDIGQLPSYIEQHAEQGVYLQQLQELSENCRLGMYTPLFTIEQAMQHRLEAIDILTNLENQRFYNS